MTDVTSRTDKPSKADTVAAGFPVGDIIVATVDGSPWVHCSDSRWLSAPKSRIQERTLVGKTVLSDDEVDQSVTGVVAGEVVPWTYTLTSRDITDLASSAIAVAVVASKTEPLLLSAMRRSGVSYSHPTLSLTWSQANRVTWALLLARGTGGLSDGDVLTGLAQVPEDGWP